MRRPDDSAGRGFRKALREIEKREPPRVVPHTDVVWEAAGDENAYRAIIDDHKLFVIEMTDDFLADQPPQFPKVSWSVSTGENFDDALVGGAAPSIDVGKARAETLWRAFLGHKQA